MASIATHVPAFARMQGGCEYSIPHKDSLDQSLMIHKVAQDIAEVLSPYLTPEAHSQESVRGCRERSIFLCTQETFGSLGITDEQRDKFLESINQQTVQFLNNVSKSTTPRNRYLYFAYGCYTQEYNESMQQALDDAGIKIPKRVHLFPEGFTISLSERNEVKEKNPESHDVDLKVKLTAPPYIQKGELATSILDPNQSLKLKCRMHIRDKTRKEDQDSVVETLAEFFTTFVEEETHEEAACKILKSKGSSVALKSKFSSTGQFPFTSEKVEAFKANISDYIRKNLFPWVKGDEHKPLRGILFDVNHTPRGELGWQLENSGFLIKPEHVSWINLYGLFPDKSNMFAEVNSISETYEEVLIDVNF